MNGRFVALCAALALVATLGATGPAAAQSTDVRALADRLNLLERDLAALQRQVYNSDRGSGGAAAASGGASDLSPQSAAQLQIRMQDLETRMRDMTGRIEQLGFEVEQNRRHLDTALADIEYRLSVLEGNPPPGGPPQAGAATPGSQGGGAASTQGRGDGATALGARSDTLGGQLAAKERGTLGPPPRSEGQSAQPTQTSAPSSASQSASLPGGDPQADYDHAFSLLRQADYGAAQQAMAAFVERYPEHELAGNAQYWLGETYYVRKDYESAAVAFATGYQKYPDSPKAPDNLLKLGMSVSALGKQPEACAAFERLQQDYPNASSIVLQRARNESNRLGC
jgi:tol-pal system protein YbgF